MINQTVFSLFTPNKMFEMFQITKNSTFRNSKITFFRSKLMISVHSNYLNFKKNFKIHGFENNVLHAFQYNGQVNRPPEVFIFGIFLKFSKNSEILSVGKSDFAVSTDNGDWLIQSAIHIHIF